MAYNNTYINLENTSGDAIEIYVDGILLMRITE